jgi:uncharacterized ion transporter superfamily protein YfcC
LVIVTKRKRTKGQTIQWPIVKYKQYNNQKIKDTQYNNQRKKDKQYNNQKKQNKQYNNQKKKDKQYNILLVLLSFFVWSLYS